MTSSPLWWRTRSQQAVAPSWTWSTSLWRSPKLRERKQWKNCPNYMLTSHTAGSTNAGCSGSKTTATATTGNSSGSAGDKDRSVKQAHKKTDSYITFCSAGAMVLFKLSKKLAKRQTNPNSHVVFWVTPLGAFQKFQNSHWYSCCQDNLNNLVYCSVLQIIIIHQYLILFPWLSYLSKFLYFVTWRVWPTWLMKWL